VSRDDRTATRLSPAHVVVLDRSGIRLPGRMGEVGVALDLDGLEVLCALAAGGAPGEAAAPLVDALRSAGFLADPSAAGAGDEGPTRRIADIDLTGGDAAVPTTAELAEGQLEVLVPLVLRTVADGFELHDHDGAVRCHLTPLELAALEGLRHASPRDLAIKSHRAAVGDRAMKATAFDALVQRMWRLGLVRRPPDNVGADPASQNRKRFQSLFKLAADVAAQVAEHEVAERDRRARTGVARTRVVPVGFESNYPPLALGLLVSYAMAHDDGRLNEHYHFPPAWILDEAKLDALSDEPGVFLVSNYLWSHERCLRACERIKELSPHSVIIHGGPDTPKYRADVEEYFALHPSVDVTVRGEGEVTTVELLERLIGVVGNGPPDLSVLDGVAGISYRRGDGVVHMPDRERLSDLDSIPSPFLTGLFDAWRDVPGSQVILETNRGCPYGCTFCDWGSSTASRVRKFSMERVFAELEWCAQNHIEGISVADANFGIWARDVEIAQKVADLKAAHGAPTAFGMSFAKNTVKHLQHIITIFREAGILGLGVLALQSMDTDTLEVVQRSNIKLEKYELLADQFRQEGLALLIELIMGLPGATVTSFQNDLQACIDRDVSTRINVAELLVNSPMNEPSYRAHYAIETDHPVLDPTHNSLVVATSTYTRQEYDEMDRLRMAYTLCEDFGVLRQISRYVRQEAGVPEVELYERIRRQARAHPDRWPLLELVTERVPQYMGPPVSWGLAMAELRRFLVDELGVADDSALEVALAVQHAVLPSSDRTFPVTLELAHDYVSWWSAVREQKRAGNHDWGASVPPLRDHGPGVLTVDDPVGLVTARIGHPFQLHSLGLNWELRSPVTLGLSDNDIEVVEAALEGA
jgi:radical SAM superfamily enzyme YgiQ (UPF0313 family)